MRTVFFQIGGNIENRMDYLALTRSMISERVGSIVKASSVYESEPWGFNHPAPFLNQVLMVSSSLEPCQVLNQASEIEAELGRVRDTEGYDARTADVDILFIDDCVVRVPGLTVPHERLHLRRFVLEPLCEVAPSYSHPILKQTVEELLESCCDEHKVWKLSQ